LQLNFRPFWKEKRCTVLALALPIEIPAFDPSRRLDLTIGQRGCDLHFLTGKMYAFVNSSAPLSTSWARGAYSLPPGTHQAHKSLLTSLQNKQNTTPSALLTLIARISGYCLEPLRERRSTKSKNQGPMAPCRRLEKVD
jgi:hypothetical protein